MKVVLTITGSQRFGTDEPEKTSLVTEGTLEREGDILLLSYEESELTGMEGTTTVFRVEPARITLQRSGTLESQMVFELGHEDRSLYDMGFGALMITVLTDRLENTLTDAGGEMDVSYSVAIENETAGHIDFISMSARRRHKNRPVPQFAEQALIFLFFTASPDRRRRGHRR